MYAYIVPTHRNQIMYDYDANKKRSSQNNLEVKKIHQCSYPRLDAKDPRSSKILVNQPKSVAQIQARSL